MMHKYLTLLILLTLSHFGYSQTADTLSPGKHHLSIVVSPVYKGDAFSAKYPTAYGLLYRYQYKPSKAVRVGAIAAYGRRSYLTTHVDHPAPKDSLFTSKLFEISFGHEWQRQLGGLFSIGYGLDAAPYMLRRQIEVDNILIGENAMLREQYRQEYSTTGVELQPFFNLRLRLSQRLYLAAECKAFLGYSKEKYTAEGTYGDVNEQPENRGVLFGGTERKEFVMGLLPLSSIQLNFSL